MTKEELVIDKDLKNYPDKMTSSQVAEALGLTLAAFYKQVERKQISIPYTKFGRGKRYFKSDVRDAALRNYLSTVEQ